MKKKKIVSNSFFVFTLLMFSSCISGLFGITGKGKIVTISSPARDFNAVELQTTANVEITKGDSFAVKVSDYENIIIHLKVEVVNQHLLIRTEPASTFLRNSKASVMITLPDPLYSVIMAGTGTVSIHSAFNDLQNLKLSGGGNIVIDEDSILNELVVNLSGTGNITAKGVVQELTVRISGSGNIFFSKMKVLDADCNLSGSGNIFVLVENKLKARISGSGNIHYWGDPLLSSEIKGSGMIIQH